jgi:S-adenosylmethionine synthetase
MSIVDAEQYLFTSESVTEGHPDKMCDQISDAILDAFIRQDPQARVACETATTTGLVMVLGEISTHAEYIDVATIVREVVKDIGYTKADYGFDYLTCGTLVSIKEQSATSRRASTPRSRSAMTPPPRSSWVPATRDDVRVRLPRDARADADADRIGAPHGPAARRGTQESASCPYLRPTARRRSRSSTSAASRSGSRPWSSPPSTTPTSGSSAAQRDRRGGHPLDDPRRAAPPRPGHARQPDRPLRHRRPDGRRRPDRPQDHRRQLRRHGPPRRRRVLRQGPDEGRPLGGVRRALGGQERGRRGLADRFEVEVAYGIGIARPVSLSVDSFGTGAIADDEILKLVERHFDLRPASIIAGARAAPADLPQTAAYGHFGREDLDLPWEQTDKAALLAEDAGLPEPEPVSAA